MSKESATIVQGALVTGNFTINATMPNGKNISVSGYAYDGESLESLNKRISLFDAAVDYQRKRSEVGELKLKLNASVHRLDDIRTHYGVILAKKSSGKKLTAQESQALDVMDLNILKHNEDILEGQKAIDEAIAEVKKG